MAKLDPQYFLHFQVQYNSYMKRPNVFDTSFEGFNDTVTAFIRKVTPKVPGLTDSEVHDRLCEDHLKLHEASLAPRILQEVVLRLINFTADSLSLELDL